MGCLVKSSLSALSSREAAVCPVDLTLDQYQQTYNGGFKLNFISGLSGVRAFKNLNFTNFYLTDNLLLDSVATHNEIKIKPTKLLTTLNFTTSSENYVHFKEASLSGFKDTDTIYNAVFYGTTTFTTKSSEASYFEIDFIDDFTCRVSTVVAGTRYHLVVADDAAVDGVRTILFVAQNQLDLDNFDLEYNLLKYKTDSFINLYSNKNDGKYIIRGDGGLLYADKIDINSRANMFFISSHSIKLNQEVNLTIPSPYDTSFITYNLEGKIDNDKSDFHLPSNYLFYSSGNLPKQDFNFFVLKNIANTQDQFTSSNNLLSTSETSIFSQNLRDYTSIFSDIDSEQNEVLALNFVYHNYDIGIKPGTTYFTAPSSMVPFEKLNINDTKFVKSGAFSFKRPDLADRVYRLDDNSVIEENVTYLCTWLSGAIGKEGIWVDRYYYPDLVSKEAALAASPAYNVTYQEAVENLIANNSSLKTSVEKKLYLDKKSDLTFEPQKRYKYVRISEDDFTEKHPTNFCNTARINKRVNNYFKTINENGGFSLGFTVQNDAGNFSLQSSYHDIDGGFSFYKAGRDVSFIFRIFDNSTSGLSIGRRIALNTFTHHFELDKFDKNNIFLSFNAIDGICTLYLNSNVIYSFNINAYQLYTKRILFGDIYLNWSSSSQEGTAERNFSRGAADGKYANKKELLFNEATTKYFIDDVYLTLSPLEDHQELAYIFSTNIDSIQDLTISLPCGMRNLTDTIKTVNSINTNLKSKSNVVDINIKNLNISDSSITDETKNVLLANIVNSLPKTTVINEVKFTNYK